MTATIPLSNSKMALIVIAVLALIFLVNFVMPTIFEEIQCKEKGGVWMGIPREGCAMSSEVCKEAEGIPIGYLECKDIWLIGCLDMGIPGCSFR